MRAAQSHATGLQRHGVHIQCTSQFINYIYMGVLSQHGAFAMSLVRPGGRACGTLRECHSFVDGASERLVGVCDCSAARVSAAAVLLKLFSLQSCGHQQLSMLSLLLGRSRPDGQLVKVFSALLVRIVRDDTSQFVVVPETRVVSMLV